MSILDTLLSTAAGRARLDDLQPVVPRLAPMNSSFDIRHSSLAGHEMLPKRKSIIACKLLDRALNTALRTRGLNPGRNRRWKK